MEPATPGSYPLAMDPIHTERLELVPATAELVRAEIEDARRFFELLDVAPADDWPTEDLRDVLPLFLDGLQDSANVGWFSWYWIDRAESAIVGGGGFKGRASFEGVVEVGYETRPAFRRRGYASESVAALADWALSQPGVRRVFAETAVDNIGSIGVLEAAGFEPSGPDREPALIGFEKVGSGNQLGPPADRAGPKPSPHR
jgi:ribosomal-protein-alanine N-acetyltransferase